MKEFGVYQYISGEPMTERDKREANSKFWNKGKWDNFVLPFLPKDCSELSLVDMGCNAGLFLRLAEDMGFDKVIGVDSDKEAIARALKYREENGGSYDIQRRRVEQALRHLPMADFTVLANVHYYMGISEWLEYVHQLESKTRFCIIVSGKKRPFKHLAGSSLDGVRDYFKNWREVGLIDNVSKEGDPSPRNLFSVCFESPIITRERIDALDNGNNQQEGFYQELDKGVDPLRTRYYWRMKSYRMKEHGWSHKQVVDYINEKAVLYENVKRFGLMKQIIVSSKSRIIDGDHRCEMLRHLGHESILIRRVL